MYFPLDCQGFIDERKATIHKPSLGTSFENLNLSYGQSKLQMIPHLVYTISIHTICICDINQPMCPLIRILQTLWELYTILTLSLLFVYITYVYNIVNSQKHLFLVRSKDMDNGPSYPDQILPKIALYSIAFVKDHTKINNNNQNSEKLIRIRITEFHIYIDHVVLCDLRHTIILYSGTF